MCSLVLVRVVKCRTAARTTKMYLVVLSVLMILLSFSQMECTANYCSSITIKGDTMYQKICCQNDNLGKTISMEQDNTSSIIITCPNEIRDSCKSVLIKETCKVWYEAGRTTSGVYTINPDDGETPFEVYCDMETNGGGWTVFQRRQDGSVDFYRNWTDYENGFGNFSGEFWLGLSKIHRLTTRKSNTLRVDLESFNNSTAYAQYSSFNIGPATTNYTLRVWSYSGGNAGDSFTYHNNMMFSTGDRDNDKSQSSHCANKYKGGWWYNKCHFTNLNGVYASNDTTGIIWYKFKSLESLKFTEMKVRN